MRPPYLSVHIPSDTRISDPVSTGVWHDNNAGIRLTAFRLGQVLDIAGQNDP